jgi:glucose 1-dehydrogenase
MSDGKLTGKVAIITGASSGIGRGIALKYAAEGASVVIDYFGDDAGAVSAKQQIEAAGGKAIISAADVSKPEQVTALVDAGWTAFGKADILVNNAGVEKASPFQDVPEADYDLVLNVNLKGPFFTTQAFVKRLLAAKMPGRVINMSSVHEDMVFPHFSTYCAAKGGLRMLMRDLAVELGPQNITVNNIAPGAVNTPINTKMMADAPELKALLANIPLGRMGSVDDIANLATFLASDDASYITGSTYVIDGGLMRSYHEQ